MFFIAYAFKGHVHAFAGQVKVVSHSPCRTSAIFKYFCPLPCTELLTKFSDKNPVQCIEIKLKYCLQPPYYILFQIKRLLKERVDQDKLLSNKDEEVKKLEGRLHNANSDKCSLQAKLATAEKDLQINKKSNELLKTKVRQSMYEGQSKISESWLISFYWVEVLAETLYTYRMNLRTSLHIEVDVLSSSMCCCYATEDRLSAMCVRADDTSDQAAMNLKSFQIKNSIITDLLSLQL